MNSADTVIDNEFDEMTWDGPGDARNRRTAGKRVGERPAAKTRPGSTSAEQSAIPLPAWMLDASLLPRKPPGVGT